MNDTDGPKACSTDERDAAAAIIAGLDACRKLLLSRAMDERERHAIRVRIVEAKLMLLCERDDTLQFLLAWREHELLGYANVARRASMAACFVRHHVRLATYNIACRREWDHLRTLVERMTGTERDRFDAVVADLRTRIEVLAVSAVPPAVRRAGDEVPDYTGLPDRIRATDVHDPCLPDRHTRPAVG
jgi:hypothetical protein